MALANGSIAYWIERETRESEPSIRSIDIRDEIRLIAQLNKYLVMVTDTRIMVMNYNEDRFPIVQDLETITPHRPISIATAGDVAILTSGGTILTIDGLSSNFIELDTHYMSIGSCNGEIMALAFDGRLDVLQSKIVVPGVAPVRTDMTYTTEYGMLRLAYEYRGRLPNGRVRRHAPVVWNEHVVLILTEQGSVVVDSSNDSDDVIVKCIVISYMILSLHRDRTLRMMFLGLSNARDRLHDISYVSGIKTHRVVGSNAVDITPVVMMSTHLELYAIGGIDENGMLRLHGENLDTRPIPVTTTTTDVFIPPHNRIKSANY